MDFTAPRIWLKKYLSSADAPSRGAENLTMQSSSKPSAKPRASFKRTVRTLLSPEQLNQAMIRESTRIDRKNSGSLTFVLFRVGGSPKSLVNSVRLARIILKRIRVTDDLGWFDGDHLGLLLPETPPSGAWRLSQMVCDAAAQRGDRPLVTMYGYPAAENGAAQGTQGVVRTTESPSHAMSIKVAS